MTTSTAVLQRFKNFSNCIFRNIWNEHTFHCRFKIIKRINMALIFLGQAVVLHE